MKNMYKQIFNIYICMYINGCECVYCNNISYCLLKQKQNYIAKPKELHLTYGM